MDLHIFIALIGALLNMLLSVTVPSILNKTERPFLMDVKKVFEVNRQVILTSSLIIAITIYLALKVTPELLPSFTNITDIDVDSNVDYDFDRTPNQFSMPEQFSMPRITSLKDVNELPPQLRNLLRLMNN